MEVTSRTFNWEKIPFFTLLQILWHLEPNDIRNLIKAVPCIESDYEYINSSPAFKFIFNSGDGLLALIKSTKLRTIFINLQTIPRMQANEYLIFISEKKRINQLQIIDDLFMAKHLTVALLDKNFEYLTKLTITSRYQNNMRHCITPILQRCPNIRTLHYAYGNLYTQCIKTLKKIQELKLKSVYVHDLTAFKEFLFTNREELKTLHCFNDPITSFGLNLHLTNAIYEQLQYLKNLKQLKIMAISNTHLYEHLEAPTYLKELIIITQEHSYLPNLYKTLTFVITEKTRLEEWLFPNACNLNPQIALKQKIESLKRIIKNQEETKVYFMNPIQRTLYVATAK